MASDSDNALALRICIFGRTALTVHWEEEATFGYHGCHELIAVLGDGLERECAEIGRKERGLVVVGHAGRAAERDLQIIVDEDMVRFQFDSEWLRWHLHDE
jgi:hypothetical protein